MKIHLIVDYSFLYYKYKFQLDSGKLKKLTQRMNWNGEVIDKDVSKIYYSLREIESFRKKYEANNDVTISVCFDMPSIRKESNEENATKYKSNRSHSLTDEDFENIRFVQQVLNNMGRNTYRFPGVEADDIVSYLTRNFSDCFDINVIYTPDMDLLVNVGNNVVAQRYKSGCGYTYVNEDNFSEYLSKELKCKMPYNGLMLYKCTVGDKSDCIDGIKKFGPKAFDKLVDYLNMKGINWRVAGVESSVEVILNNLTDYLTEDQLRQARESLSLVRPYVFETGMINPPESIYNAEIRKSVYESIGMPSLAN